MKNTDNIRNLISSLKSKIAQASKGLDENTVIELEARLGYINDMQSDNRIFIPTSHPVVFNTNYVYHFHPGASRSDFAFFENEVKKINKNLSEEGKEPLTVKNTKDMTIKANNSRYTILDNKITENIIKSRICVFDVLIPSSAYDIRFSVSKEEKLPIVGNIPSSGYRRARERRSYKDSSGLSYEFTQVKSRSLKDNFEVEIEITEFGKDCEKVEEFIEKSFDLLTRKELK